MKLLLLILAICTSQSLQAADIVLLKKNATVWLPDQTIHGELQGFSSSSVTVHLNDSSFVAPVVNNKFQFVIRLRKNLNIVRVSGVNGNATVTSESLELVLPFDPFPVLHPFAEVAGDKISLKHKVIEAQQQMKLTYEWKASVQNPAPVVIDKSGDSVATATIPAVPGEYFFTLYARSGQLVDSFKTMVTRSGSGLKAFDLLHDKASWINRAVIYQVTPYIFTSNRKYTDIEAKLIEIVELGINTLYLQPVFKTQRRGQGYDIVDYFSLREDLGTEAELRSLIEKAKSLNMRILFDIVPNHTSISHPYAQNRIKFGQSSHYYDYYQSAKDSAMYSMHYHKDSNNFIYYFWTQLVNLNYNNEEVQRWMLEACKYWVRKFDIDGYRFDAVWGVNARTPAFSRRLQMELKSLKPDILMIAEDKADPANAYRQGFDAAYDWGKSEEWVSKWAWQYEYDEGHYNTIFNHPSLNDRKLLLRKALFSDGDSIGLRLRYLENNDLHRFISNHSRDITKMAATLLFTLHGMPMVYNGQETGFRLFPYSSGPIYDPGRRIRSYDPNLFDFYAKLSSIRSSNHALTNGTIEEVELNNAPGVLAFHRKSDSQDVVVLINLSGSKVNPAVKQIKGDALPNVITLIDLITGDTLFATKQVNGYVVPVDASSTRVLMLDRKTDIPASRPLLNIVPNPSEGSFVLNYNMEEAGPLKIRVSDSNGRILLNTMRSLPAGRSSITLSVAENTSGTCYVSTDDGTQVRSAGVVLLRR